MDDDDFGDLYGDPAPSACSIPPSSFQNSFSAYTFFDDDIADEKKSSPAGHPANSRPSPLPPELLPVVLDQPADRDSDEDDDMLLLGYNSKSGSAGIKPQASADDNVVDKEIKKLPESTLDENADDDELGSPPLSSSRAVAVGVPGITPKQEVKVAALSSMNGLNMSDFSHQSIPGLTIPGISTTVNAPFFDMGDNGDAAQDAWELDQGGKPSKVAETDFSVEKADDWDSDSDDDLRIVLNNQYPYYGGREKGLTARQEGLSEDEDDEELIIFAGGEPNEEGEEQLLQPPDAQALPGDGSVHPPGEKQIVVDDGKGQQVQVIPGVGIPGQAGRGYGYSYNSPYKYVRAGAAGMYGTGATPGQNLGGRMGPLKSVGGRGDWRGSGRGSSGLQYSGSSNYEYTLPPHMTVFDIDLESFEEKPWRQFDVTDYFNFGFDEMSWKEYCKQLAQLRLESTMHGKIRVYESGRSEQEYDPDLPPELAAAAGLPESADRGQQRLESDAAVSGIRRGYTPMIPYGRPIEVEGGLGDRRPSSDLKKQRLRDSDSILLIDVIEEDDVEEELLVVEGGVEGLDSERNKDDMEEEQQRQEEQQEEEEEARVNGRGTFLKAGPEEWENERKSKAMFDGMVAAMDHNRSQGGRPTVPTVSRKISVESPPTGRQKTISKPLDEENRDLDQVRSQSGMRQDVESKPRSGIAEDDYYVSKQRGKAEHIQKHDTHTEEAETGQRASLTPTRIRDVHTSDKLTLEGEVESSGGSSKRPRLVSPEGSHTASWDNYDLPKPARKYAYRKESRDSGESAFDGREGSSSHRKKSKSHSEASREDGFKHSKHGFDPHHRKQASMISGHDSERELYDGQRSDSLHDSKKRLIQGRNEEDVARDASRQWKTREDAHSRGRDEEAERKAYLAKETSYREKAAERNKGEEYRDAAYQRDGGGRRSDSKRKEEAERRDRQDSRRRDDVKEGYEKENRHRETRDYQHREKEVDELHHFERRRKEDHRRRDYAEEGSDHMIKSNQEKHTPERHEQETNQNVRRKEEHTWKKAKVEDHHRPKARDGSTRDREDSRQQHKEHQDPLARGHKHQERTSQGGSGSRRQDENRTSYGSRLSLEEPRRSQSRDKRTDIEEHSKDNKGRPREGKARSRSDREGLPLLEIRERETGRHDRLSDDPRTSEKRSHAEKYRLDAKRSKDLEKGPKDPPQFGDHATASRKRKGPGEKTEMANKQETLEESLTARVIEEQSGVTRAHPEGSKEASAKPRNKLRHSEARDKGFPEDNEAGQRGRSKLERWMSHKDLEPNASERAKKDERSRPILAPREKKRCEDQKQDTQQIAGIDDSAATVSSCELAANGKVPVPKPDEKGDVIVHKKDKDSDVGAKEKDGVEQLPAVLQKEASLPKTNLAAKLEKRKERFKVCVEDMDSSRKVGHEDRQAADKDDARQERPPRKRRWASG